ncbi:hypothetical protein [Chromatium okenii]|nr:hypothetical protein [Chromatium okenii]
MAAAAAFGIDHKPILFVIWLQRLLWLEMALSFTMPSADLVFFCDALGVI